MNHTELNDSHIAPPFLPQTRLLLNPILLIAPFSPVHLLSSQHGDCWERLLHKTASFFPAPVLCFFPLGNRAGGSRRLAQSERSPAVPPPWNTARLRSKAHALEERGGAPSRERHRYQSPSSGSCSGPGRARLLGSSVKFSLRSNPARQLRGSGSWRPPLALVGDLPGGENRGNGGRARAEISTARQGCADLGRERLESASVYFLLPPTRTLTEN